MLLRDEADVIAEGEAYVVIDSHQKLGAIIGRPSVDCLRSSLADTDPALELLCERADHEHLVAALPDWLSFRAVLHTLPDGAQPNAQTRDVEHQVVVFDDDLPAHASVDAHREEHELAVQRGAVATTFVEGQAVAWCATASLSESWWDASVDTLEAWRRKGLAAAASVAMIDHMLGKDRRAVWGALENNSASRGLAQRLGFRASDELFLFARADVEDRRHARD